MEYKFDSKGNLLPQVVKKCDLAFFYGVTPRQFRNEIENFISVQQTWNYTTQQVERIFKHFGSVPSRADVERAQPRIQEYLKEVRAKNVKRYFDKK